MRRDCDMKEEKRIPRLYRLCCHGFITCSGLCTRSRKKHVNKTGHEKTRLPRHTVGERLSSSCFRGLLFLHCSFKLIKHRAAHGILHRERESLRILRCPQLQSTPQSSEERGRETEEGLEEGQKCHVDVW